MADPDIAIRLREADGGYFMRKMFTEAAEEIERLRAERDEARREVCELRADIGFSRPLVPHMLEFAASRGWDCFGKDTNG